MTESDEEQLLNAGREHPLPPQDAKRLLAAITARLQKSAQERNDQPALESLRGMNAVVERIVNDRAKGDVWERLRVVTINESRLQAALRTIAQACGLGPGSLDSMSIDGITVKAVQLIKAGKDADAAEQAMAREVREDFDGPRFGRALRAELEQRIVELEDAAKAAGQDITTLEHHMDSVKTQRDTWERRALGAEKRVAELEAAIKAAREAHTYDAVGRRAIAAERRVKDLEAHLRDRDEACEQWAAKVKEFEAKHIRAKELAAENERLSAVVQRLEREAVDSSPAKMTKPRPIEPWIHAPDIEKVLAKEFYADVSPLTRKDVGAMINIALRAVGVTY